MVIALKPGRFYGRSLPRPHIYTDLKFSSERVDPPASVNDALLRWAGQAHWSMGGLSLKRPRLQGKIEGRLHKLRAERDQSQDPSPVSASLELKSTPRKSAAMRYQSGFHTKSLSPIDRLLLKEQKGRDDVSSPSPKRKVGQVAGYGGSPAASNANATARTVAKAPVKRVVRRALLVEDSDEESDDGLDEFLKDTSRPLRRSGRLQGVSKSLAQDDPSEINAEQDRNVSSSVIHELRLPGKRQRQLAQEQKAPAKEKISSRKSPRGVKKSKKS